jgi:predicted HAD superfamily Cof-like phosphohydrolase
MNPYEQKAREFHVATELAVDRAFDVALLELRKTLIAEEVRELFAEIDRAIAELRQDGQVGRETRLNMMKEVADVQYVLSGTSVSFGLPAEEVFARVHASNMSKLGPDGKPLRRADGKVLKGPNYHPPVLDDLLPDDVTREAA